LQVPEEEGKLTVVVAAVQAQAGFNRNTMTSPPTNIRPEQPHLVSLVLQSKKALQHGEQLCSRANSLSSASAQSALDVLALDAKVKWITDAVLEQLKVSEVFKTQRIC
jgi:hypothetical protein